MNDLFASNAGEIGYIRYTLRITALLQENRIFRINRRYAQYHHNYLHNTKEHPVPKEGRGFL